MKLSKNYSQKKRYILSGSKYTLYFHKEKYILSGFIQIYIIYPQLKDYFVKFDRKIHYIFI